MSDWSPFSLQTLASRVLAEASAFTAEVAKVRAELKEVPLPQIPSELANELADGGEIVIPYDEFDPNGDPELCQGEDA